MSHSRYWMEWLAWLGGSSQEHEKEWVLRQACDYFNPPLNLELLARTPNLGHTVSLRCPKFPHMGPPMSHLSRNQKWGKGQKEEACFPTLILLPIGRSHLTSNRAPLPGQLREKLRWQWHTTLEQGISAEVLLGKTHCGMWAMKTETAGGLISQHGRSHAELGRKSARHVRFDCLVNWCKESLGSQEAYTNNGNSIILRRGYHVGQIFLLILPCPFGLSVAHDWQGRSLVRCRGTDLPGMWRQGRRQWMAW